MAPYLSGTCRMFFLVCMSCWCSAHAQSDSLHSALKGSVGKKRIEFLNTLTTTDTISFADYHQEAIALAKQLKDSTGEVRALSAMGDHYYLAGDLQEACDYYSQSIRLAGQYGLHSEEIVTLGKKGIALEENAQPESALLSYNEALSKSQQWGPQKEEAIALEQLGIFYLNQHNYTMSAKYLHQQLALNEQLKDSSGLAICLNNLGLVYYSLAEYTNSIIYYRKSLNIKERLHDSLAVAQCKVNIGISYKEEGAYDLALESLLDAARYFEQQPADLELGSCYNTIGSIQLELNHPDSALFYFFKSLQIREKIHNKRGIAGSLTNIGNAYKQKGDYTLAMNYLEQSLVIKHSIGDSLLLASTFDLMGEVYFLRKDYERAEDYYSMSIALRRVAGDQKGMAMTLNNLGALYSNWGKADSSIGYLKAANNIAQNIGARQVLLRNYGLLMTAYRLQGNLDSALHFYDKYTLLHDSIFNERQGRILTELQLKYETEKSEQKIRFLNEEEKLLQAEITRQKIQNYLLGLSTVLLVIIAFLTAIAYRTRSKAYKQSRLIIEQKQMIIEQKQTMMRELHHRIKNNLQTITSMLELQQADVTGNNRNTLQSISARLNAMLLIHRDLYNADSDGLVNMKIYLQKLANSISESFGFAGRVQINIDCENILLEADAALNMGFICNEVITNAFKHAFDGTSDPKLHIFFTDENTALQLQITDNGRGMPPEKLNESNESFGLKLIRLFTLELNASMHFQSTDTGTIFRLTIPKS